jgi:lysophospholipase L1-like esterase
MTDTSADCLAGKRFIYVRVLLALLVCFMTATAQGTVIQRLERGDHLNIVAIGTSLTATSFNAQNWFAQAGAWLQTKYPGQVTLSNRAVSGEISAILPPRWTQGGPWQLEQVLANDNPDVVFIEFAINDAYKAVNFTPAVSANNLKTLIDRINTWAANRSKAVDIIVQTMNNTGPSYAALENDTAPYYQAWREQAAASKVLLIDHEPNWIHLYNSQPDHATWKSYITDDIHPNTQGITTVILPEIQRVLMSQVPEPSCAVLLSAALLGLLAYAGWKKRLRITTVVLGALVLSAAGATSASATVIGNIMPLGDSITYGTVAGGYRARLYDRLTADSDSFRFVGSFTDNPNAALTAAGQAHHEGHPSIRIDQIEANLDGNTNFTNGNGGFWLSGTTGRPAVCPDIILLMAGINDIATGANATTTRDRLDSLLNHIYTDRPTTTVIVASLTPLTGTPASKWEATADAYNAMIPGVVAKYATAGKHAYYLDMHTKLTSDDISSDGVHLTQAGYNKMGDAWFGAIQTVPEPSCIAMLSIGAIVSLAVCCHRRYCRRIIQVSSLSQIG